MAVSGAMVCRFDSDGLHEGRNVDMENKNADADKIFDKLQFDIGFVAPEAHDVRDAKIRQAIRTAFNEGHEVGVETGAAVMGFRNGA